MKIEEAIEILENGGWWDLLIPITTIEGRSDEDKLHQAIDMAVSALRSMQETTKPGWISVKERLPDDKKDGETVLAIVSGKPHKNITLCHALMTAGYFPGEGWVVNEYPEWENPTITHWMPLPDPPEEG